MWASVNMIFAYSSLVDYLINYINNYNGTHTLEINKFLYNPIYKGAFKPGLTDSCSFVDNNFGRFLESSSLDWREKGVVTKIKDQGNCGSCWSFSATGALESVWAIHCGHLESFSEQELVDCSTAYGNDGCNGGEMTSAFQYVIDNGICLESDIPYVAHSESCSKDKCNSIPHFSSCKKLESGNQKQMMRYLQYHPLSVGIQANKPLFTFYKSGVITTTDCGTDVDHGVLIVGYGTENGIDYWLVKNSWGEDWGEKGYVKIARSLESNDIGVCGIASEVSFPEV